MTETDISAEIVFTLIATLHYSRYSFTKSDLVQRFCPGGIQGSFNYHSYLVPRQEENDEVSSRRDVNM